MDMTGLSRSEVYRRASAGEFPRPVSLGERQSRWREREVQTWIRARIAERDKVAA
jgi:prophage regulatory protein